MTRRILLIALLIPQLLVAQAPPGKPSAPNAPSAPSASERVFLDTPTPDRARRWLAALTEDPHVAGTPAEKKVADYVLARFKEFGLDAEMVRYDVFLNHPREVKLTLTSPVREELKLSADPYDVEVEREFLDARGLPGRPWFRHLLIAPGLTTGYAPWPFPALQQAVEERDAGIFASEAKKAVEVIRAAVARLRAAAR